MSFLRNRESTFCRCILYVKITEVCQAEIESIEEEDCIIFLINLVINRTFDGYQSEIQTI